MAAARDTVAEHIKPLEVAIERRGTLGATTEAGEVITLQSVGFWDPSIATGVQFSVRIAVQGGVAGDRVDQVCYGPVVCMTGATIGARIFNTDTAGEMAETAGTKDTIVGYAESATVLFVQPQIIDMS
jgi:hypothetical protein